MEKQLKNTHVLPRLCPEASYVLEDHRLHGDWFQEFFESEKDALAWADYRWSLLTAFEKTRIEAFFVASITHTGDDDDPDYEVGAVVREYC
jgi:hypothetical protein